MPRDRVPGHHGAVPRLVLVSLHVEPSPEALPLGAASVGAALKADPTLGPRLALLLVEGFVSESPELIAARIVEARPDWIGFSLYSWNRRSFAEVAARLRGLGPEMLLFAGGPEASADPAGVLAELPLDFLVLGEGEVAATRALKLLAADRTGVERPSAACTEALAAIAGIALPGRAAEARRAPPADLAALPSPWLSRLLDARRRDGLVWELSRGCPFHCAYCYESKGEGSVRQVPLRRLEAELELFIQSGASQVFILDPTFNADRRRALELLALFRRRAPGLYWKFEIRAELIDRRLARSFAALDCSLQIGLQSARPEVLARVGRPGFDRKRFARQLRILDEEGVSFGLDLIYGLPGDDLEGFKSSLDYALSLAPNHLDIFPLAVLPGTELAERAGEFGLDAEASAPHLLRSSPGFGSGDLAAAADLAHACEIFYCSGRAVAWFLGVLRPLGVRASVFLGRFAAWLKDRRRSRGDPGAVEAAVGGLSSREVEALQLDFLEAEYRRAGLERLLPPLRDLVRLNGAWGRALAEGESTELRLSYGTEELMGPLALDLQGFVRKVRPRTVRLLVAPGPGGPVLRRLPNKAVRRKPSQPS